MVHRADERLAGPGDLSATLVIESLPPQQRPLLDRFYRDQKSKMRASKTGESWVVRQGDIRAAVNLEPMVEGCWLRGLLVATDARRGGLARRLLLHCLAATNAPVWLFCNPGLAPLYQSVGFRNAEALPQELTSRLRRYRQGKSLVALERPRMEIQMPPSPSLMIATACLLDRNGRVLLVRKRDTRYYMLPGGKAEPGETPVQTLVRELREELGIEIQQQALDPLGRFEAQAANEPGHRVCADVFVGKLDGSVEPLAELESLVWLEVFKPDQGPLAPLFAEQVLPALRHRINLGGR